MQTICLEFNKLLGLSFSLPKTIHPSTGVFGTYSLYFPEQETS